MVHLGRKSGPIIGRVLEKGWVLETDSTPPTCISRDFAHAQVQNLHANAINSAHEHARKLCLQQYM